MSRSCTAEPTMGSPRGNCRPSSGSRSLSLVKMSAWWSSCGGLVLASVLRSMLSLTGIMASPWLLLSLSWAPWPLDGLFLGVGLLIWRLSHNSFPHTLPPPPPCLPSPPTPPPSPPPPLVVDMEVVTMLLCDVTRFEEVPRFRESPCVNDISEPEGDPNEVSVVLGEIAELNPLPSAVPLVKPPRFQGLRRDVDSSSEPSSTPSSSNRG